MRTPSRNILPVLLAAFALLGSLPYLGAEGPAKGSDSRGKFFFKKSCKTCHGPGGPAQEVTPLARTQEQWKVYFEAGAHKKGMEKLDSLQTPEQLLDIQTFLINHASDSPQPETCG